VSDYRSNRLFEVGEPTAKERANERSAAKQGALFAVDAVDALMESDDGDEWTAAANELAAGWLDTEVPA